MRTGPRKVLAGVAAVLAILAAAASLVPNGNGNLPQRTQSTQRTTRPFSVFSVADGSSDSGREGARTRRTEPLPQSLASDLASEVEREDDHVTALELAQWIRERKPGLRVLDVRSDSEFAVYHIPSAERMPLSTIATLKPDDGETLVLYSEGGAHAAQGWVLLRTTGHRNVYFLRGGLLDWMEDVMSPALPADTSRARIAALSRYFGGTPRAGVVPFPAAGATAHRAADSTATTAASAVARMRRRGC